jgi:hypothetical protein
MRSPTVRFATFVLEGICRQPRRPKQQPGHHRMSALGGIRTHTGRVLSPSFLAFGGSSCVGRVGEVLVRGLVVLTDESGYQLYCGRPADGLGFTYRDGRPSAGEDGS